MKKTDIIEKLRALHYEPARYRVVAGGAMVLYGFREDTHDIDLGCTPEMADRLEQDGYLTGVSEDGNRKFRIGGDIEIFENWCPGPTVVIEGLNVISVPGLIKMKTELGREKDKRDLELIKRFTGGNSK